MLERVKGARDSERAYHEDLYANHRLGEPGTWLHQPAEYVLRSFGEYARNAQEPIRVLDLGSGIGRHSIPLAQRLNSGSEVVCVDRLRIATQELGKNALEHGVEDRITGRTSDVESFPIEPQSFDFVLSVSCIEHVPTKPQLEQLIKRLQEGTRQDGTHCFMMITDTVWVDTASGQVVEPLLEQNLGSDETIKMLEALYGEWQIHDLSTAAWRSVQTMGQREVAMESTSVRFIGQKQPD